MLLLLALDLVPVAGTRLGTEGRAQDAARQAALVVQRDPVDQAAAAKAWDRLQTLIPDGARVDPAGFRVNRDRSVTLVWEEIPQTRILRMLPGFEEITRVRVQVTSQQGMLDG